MEHSLLGPELFNMWDIQHEGGASFSHVTTPPSDCTGRLNNTVSRLRIAKAQALLPHGQCSQED
jgi:hypothetical protein